MGVAPLHRWSDWWSRGRYDQVKMAIINSTLETSHCKPWSMRKVSLKQHIRSIKIQVAWIKIVKLTMPPVLSHAVSPHIYFSTILKMPSSWKGVEPTTKPTKVKARAILQSIEQMIPNLKWQSILQNIQKRQPQSIERRLTTSWHHKSYR